MTQAINDLITATNAKLDAMNVLLGGAGLTQYVDGLETLIGTTNTSLTAITNSLTTLQGYVDGLETLGGTLNSYVDGLEGLMAAPSTAAKSNVSGSASSVSVLASNASRKGATFFNDSSDVCCLDLSGGTASATSYSVKVLAGGFFELPDGKRGVYTGAITGIWGSATGTMRVTEFT